MSKEPEMTAAEQNLRACQKQLDMDGVMVGVSRQALEETLAELDASRAREAKLVEALRPLAVEAALREGEWSSVPDEAVLLTVQITMGDARRARAALAPYTPAEMPSDVHPQEG